MNAFRNQGGYLYIGDYKYKGDPLYDKIMEYYVSQYKLQKRIENVINLEKEGRTEYQNFDPFSNFCKEVLPPEIKDIINNNEELQEELSKLVINES